MSKGASVFYFCFFILGGLLLVASEAQAVTNIPKNITSDKTYAAADGPFLISGTGSKATKIAEGATVTFEAGSVVQFTKNAWLDVRGRLVVSGTEEEKVTFTSDDEEKEVGQWGYIRFTGSATGVFSHTIIEYGGVTSFYRPAIHVMANSPGVSLDNVIIYINPRRSRGVRLKATPYTKAVRQDGFSSVTKLS